MIAIRLLIVVLLLSGCAHTALNTSGQCNLSTASEQVVRLTVTPSEGKRQLMLLHNSWEVDQFAVVAIDPIGVVLFSGEFVDGEVRTRASPLYRGVDATTLLRVYGWWLQRDNRASCWSGDGFSLRTLAGGEQQLIASGKLEMLWRPDQPSQVDLPRQGIRLTFKETQ